MLKRNICYCIQFNDKTQESEKIYVPVKIKYSRLVYFLLYNNINWRDDQTKNVANNVDYKQLHKT